MDDIIAYEISKTARSQITHNHTMRHILLKDVRCGFAIDVTL